MLVLSRKKDQGIWLGNDINVVIVDIRGDKVRLGIEAAAEIPVHRNEIHEAILRAGKELPSLVPQWQKAA